MNMRSLLFGACLVGLAACGPSAQEEEEGDGAGVLPNSLADTSAHEAERAIPAYGPGAAVSDSSRTAAAARGQVLYVPVYSHIFQRNAEREFALTATLSIRNTSTSTSIVVRAVDYFNSEGTLLRSYVDAPRRIGPLASTYVVVEEEDLSGGVGANFIVEWRGAQPVSAPLVEAVMTSTANTQGISFVGEARVLQAW